MENPLQYKFNIENLQICYDLLDDNFNLIEHDPSDHTHISIFGVDSLTLDSQKKIEISLKIQPLCTGYLIIKGIQWKFLYIPTRYLLSVENNNYFNKFKILP